MNSKQLTLSSEPKKSYSRSLQISTDVVIDSENNKLFRFSKLFIHLFFFATKCFKDKLTAPKLSGFKN
jgi:hypothetical protein